MDKIAQLKHAEVAGVISGLIDGGYIKLASEQEFEDLTGIVAGSISDNWDLNEVLDKTAEVMDSVDMDKTAKDVLHDALAEYGYLCISKEAGEVSDVEFEKQAGLSLKGIAEMLKGTPAKWGKKLKDTASLKDARTALDAIKTNRASFAQIEKADPEWAYRFGNKATKMDEAKKLLKALKDPAKLYGGVAGAGAGLYGNRDAIAAKFKAGKKAILG